MSQTFFIADTHFGHRDIHKKFRTEFTSDEEHNAIIHDNILSCSNKRNDIYILGDIVFKTDYFPFLREYAERFRKVHVVLGNHDHKAFAAYACKQGIQVHGFIAKFNTWISHCPVHPQEMYRALGNIHGHLHTNKVLVKEEDESWVDDIRYLCVSCEQVNYKPINLQQIREEFRSRGIQLK